NSQLAEYSAKSYRSAHLPSLSARLSYSDDKSYSDRTTISDRIIADSSEPDFGQRRISEADTCQDSQSEGWNASINLSVPIYAGGRVSAQRRQAYSQSMRADDLARLTQRRTSQLARSAHQAVETGVVRVEALQQA